MATKTYLGGGPTVAQLQYYIATGITPGAVVSLTLNSRTVSYTAQRASASDAINGIVAAIQAAAAEIGEFGANEMVPSAVTSTVGAQDMVPVLDTPMSDGTGGLLNFNTTYGYRITALSQYGESLASAEVTLTTANDAVANHTVSMSWTAVAGAASYNIYGRDPGAETFLTNTVATGWADDGRLAPSAGPGGTLPTADTSAQLAMLLLTAGTPGKPFTAPTASASVGAGGGSPAFTALGGTAAPSCSTASVSTGGILHSSTTYYYRVSSVTPFGVSVPNTEFSLTTGGGANTYRIRITITEVVGAIGYNVYGRSTGAELFMAFVPAGVGSVIWTDDGVVSPAGAMPVADSSDPTKASSGPEDWATTGNWAGGVLPGNGDDVFITGISTNILYSLNQSAVSLASLNLPSSFTGLLGLPRLNVDGNVSYNEYRPQYLQIGATVINIGGGAGGGSNRIKIDSGSVAASINVFLTGAGQDEGGTAEAFLWKGTSASNVMSLISGSVGVAVLPGETANLSGGLTIGNAGTPASNVAYRSGPEVTYNAITCYGGTSLLQSNVTTFTQKQGGSTAFTGTATCTTMTLQAGTVFWMSSGTITTLTISATTDTGGVRNQGAFDRSQAAVACTITNLVQMYSGSILNDPNGTIAFTAGIHLNQCTVLDVTINVGPNRSVAIT